MLQNQSTPKNHKRFFYKMSLTFLLFILILAISFGNTGITPASARDDDTQISYNEYLSGERKENSAQQTDQIIIKYKDAALMDTQFEPKSLKQAQRLSEIAGTSVDYVREMSGNAHILRLPNKMPLTVVEAISKKFLQLPEVENAEPDIIMQHTLTPNDPRYTNQWHYFAPTAGNYGINAPAAWDISTGVSSIVIAVIDTGITNHVEFIGRTVPGYDFIDDIPTANDGDGRDADPSDPGDWVAKNECGPGEPASNSSWHGTHVSGTIGAASNNGVGVAGINWESKILPVRVLGKCGGYMSDIIDGMVWAAGLSVAGVPANANPAKIINISLGGTSTCDTSLQNAIDSVIAAGTTIVVAAGNSNSDASTFTPANCNGVITVSATNKNGNRASYSNYGSVVEISAPGGDSLGYILSTLNTGTQGPVADSYAGYQGTSMAAPHVAGVVSLMYSRNPLLTPAEVLAILQSTVTLFPSGSTCNTSICGSGIVNAGAAVSATFEPTAVELISFSAVGAKKSVVLTWETATEIDNLGFNLYRSESIDGERIQLNKELILTDAYSGAPFGSIYEFTDSGLKPNHTYYYWLEDIDIWGIRKLHGPVITTTSLK